MSEQTKQYDLTVHVNTVDGVSVIYGKITRYKEVDNLIGFETLDGGEIVIWKEKLIYFRTTLIAPESEADHD